MTLDQVSGGALPDCECLGAVFPLAGGEAGVLSRTLPRGRGIEQFVKARYRVCETIGADVHNVERDGGW